MKASLFIVVGLSGIVLFPNFANSSCVQFNGKYTINFSGCYHVSYGNQYPDYSYSGVEIKADSSNNLSIFYKDKYSGQQFNYIADGQEHDGDLIRLGKRILRLAMILRLKSFRTDLKKKI